MQAGNCCAALTVRHRCLDRVIFAPGLFIGCRSEAAITREGDGKKVPIAVVNLVFGNPLHEVG
jgi:hypothetical protein